MRIRNGESMIRRPLLIPQILRAVTVAAVAWLLPSALLAQKGKQAQVNVQRTSMTRDQEIKIGKDAAAQVEREMEVIKTPDAQASLNQIGHQFPRPPPPT